MKVKVAETAGFCFGVKRAVDKVYQLIEEGTHPIYTLGPIIHNEEVVTDLAAKGVQVIEEKDLASLTEGTVVIRSHGVGKAIYQELKENHLNYVDVTCPFVLKIHRIVEKQSHAGKHVVIFGDPDHPEVKGICGWCQGSFCRSSVALQIVFKISPIFKTLLSYLFLQRISTNSLNLF